MVILEKYFNWHLEAFASELFKYTSDSEQQQKKKRLKVKLKNL